MAHKKYIPKNKQHIFIIGFETYFPVSDVHVTLPNNEKIVSILQDRPLLQFTAKSFHELSYQRYLQVIIQTVVV